MKDEALAALPGLAQTPIQILRLQRARIAGSFCARPAFIGKSVWGRKTVGRKSCVSWLGASVIGPIKTGRKISLRP